MYYCFMKKILCIIIIIPVISFSQNNDFLTKLFLDSTEIKNQDFLLTLVGVINPEAQIIKGEYDSYYDEYSGSFLSEILFLEDLLVAKQIKSNVYIGNKNDDNFENKCSWNLTGQNENLKMISSYELDYFPTFSFLKGKLLTIIDIDSSEKDYLFSVSKSTNFKNYGHNTLTFNLTDDNEKGYKINTIIIDEQCYIIFKKSEMAALGFSISNSLINKSKFKVDCKGEEVIVNDRYTRMDRSRNCYCICSSDYFSFFREKTKYMSTSYNLNEDKLLYLFKLENQN